MTDPYFHRTVALRAGGRRLELATSQELFSSHQVDRGSRLLMRVGAEVLGDGLIGSTVLDVGCGYGPLGLGLRAMGAARAVLVDRDALAVEYAAANAAANGLDAVECYGSVGYDDVRGSFDVVVANVPGHASAGVIGHFVADAGSVLVRGGYAAFVVVDPLADAIESNLAEVVRRVDDRGHTVLVAQFPPAAEDRSSDRDRYRRGIREFGAHGRTWRVGTAEGVPEFERMSHHTTAVLDYLEAVESGPRVAVWNPGQGHIPIFLAARQQRSVLQLADRDLLALRFTDGNLAGNRVRPDPTILVHGLQVAADGGPFDVVVDVLRRSEPPAAAVARIVHARSLLAEGGAVVISGPGQSPRRVAAGLEEQGVPVRRKPARRSLVLTVG